MSKLPLTFACGFYDRMHALYTRDVVPEGIELNFTPIDDPREVFDRMVGRQEFDCSEMSASEFITRKSAGRCPFVALPVFISKVFRHQFIFINRRSGIRHPKDLEGRRIGVPLFIQTAAVWIRGLLQHEYGVDLSTLRWVQGGMNHPGAHGNPTILPLLRPAAIEINASGKSLSTLLEEGDIDAIVTGQMPEPFGRNPDIVRLFPDYRRVEQDYYKRTHIFPIMHLLAIRSDVYEKHPFVAASLYDAMCRSKDMAIAKMRDVGALRFMLPWLVADFEEIDKVFGSADPWPYGIEPNRPTLEALVRYMAEQGLIAATMPIEDLFVPTSGGH